MKLKDLRRIGAAILMAVAMLAQSMGADIDQEMMDKTATAWNDLITYGSGFVAIVLALWSKIASAMGKDK